MDRRLIREPRPQISARDSSALAIAGPITNRSDYLRDNVPHGR